MKVALLAKGQTLERYPGREGYDEVWGLNQLGMTHRLDRLYVMDDLRMRMPAWDPDLPEWLKSYEGRLITSRVYPEWNAEAFPLTEVARYFGLPLGISFYSTVDYMLAHAIFNGVDHIDMFGIDCSHPRREERERVSIARWIGVAQQRGIRVTAQSGSFFKWYTDVGTCYEHGLYGYSGPPRIEDFRDGEVPSNLELAAVHSGSQ